MKTASERKNRGPAMGQSRKNQYFLFRRKSKKRKEATNFHCCHRQKYLQTKRMERAGPTLFNEYFFPTLSLYSAIFWALNIGLGIDIYFSVPFVSDF